MAVAAYNLFLSIFKIYPTGFKQIRYSSHSFSLHLDLNILIELLCEFIDDLALRLVRPYQPAVVDVEIVDVDLLFVVGELMPELCYFRTGSRFSQKRWSGGCDCASVSRGNGGLWLFGKGMEPVGTHLFFKLKQRYNRQL